MFKYFSKLLENWRIKRKIKKDKEKLIESLDRRGLIKQSALIEILSEKK